MKKYLFFILLIILQSCTSEKGGDENVTVFKKYHKGRYGRGSLFKEIPIVDGKYHGIHKTYYVSGKVMIEEMFEMGESKWIKIYSGNGNLEEFRYTLGENSFSSAYFYYDTNFFFETAILEEYICYDYNGNLFYIAKYDKQDKMIDQRGLTMCIPKIEKKIDSIYISFPYANPPKSHVRVFIEYDSLNYVEIEAKNRIVNFTTDSATLAKGFVINTKLYRSRDDYFVFGSKLFVSDTLSLQADIQNVKIYLKE